MTVVTAPKWWRGRDHRRIRGSRGARFVSLRFHYLFIFGIFALIQYTLRGHDDVAYHLPDPPVPPPPPLPNSVGYSVGREMPYWTAIETEEAVPAHVPQRPVHDFRTLNPTATHGRH